MSLLALTLPALGEIQSATSRVLPPLGHGGGVLVITSRLQAIAYSKDEAE